MDYYGKKVSRIMYLGQATGGNVDDPNDPIGFIKAKGILTEFIEQRVNSGRHKNQIFVIETEKLSGLVRLSYNGNQYLYGASVLGKFRENIEFYKLLSTVYDDNDFRWKENKKYNTMETIVRAGRFDFHCIYKMDGNGSVDIRYTKQDNRHRNNVTIATLNVFDASNEAFIEAITQWKTEFMEDLSAA